MSENRFTGLTDEMFELFISCIKSGFTEPQAFDLTKAYCSVAFVNQAINLKNEEIDRYRKIRRNITKKNTVEE